MTDARPFVKWAGGKTKSLPELLKHVPEEIGTYVEPFVGAGALFFELARQKRFKKAIVGDTNAELINAYIVIWRSLPALIVQLERHKYEEKHFYEVRAQDPAELSDVARAARFIFLNKTCFNGLYRVNKAGKFNSPFGRYTNPTICDADNLRAISQLLQSIDVAFCNYSFEGTTPANLKPSDFVYCDPPYDVVSDTADFTGYSKDGFGWDDQVRLEFWARNLRLPKVVLSNADTPRIRKLYGNKEGSLPWNVHEVEAVRAINSSGEKRGKVKELIISSHKMWTS